MRAVWVDGGVEQRLLSSPTFETGLLLGQAFDPTRSYLLHSIPTPPSPHLPPSTSFTSHTSQWLLAHALQLDRMTLPGLSLLGLYVRSSPDDLRALDASNALRDLVYSLPGMGERFVVKCGGGKLACEVWGGTRKEPGRGRSVQVKVERSLVASLVQFRCCLNIDWLCRVDRLGSGGPGELAAAVLQASELLGDVLKASMTTLDEERRDSSTALEKTGAVTPEMKAGKGKGKKAVTEAASDGEGGLHRMDVFIPVRLLTPPLEPPPGSSSSSFSFLHLRGSLLSRAFLHPKQSVGNAVAAVHRDLCASLHHRLQLLLEEEEEGRGGGWGEEGEGVRSLARRMIVDLGDGLMLGDYLVDGEAEADGLRRMEELAPGRTQPLQRVEEVESSATAMQLRFAECKADSAAREPRREEAQDSREVKEEADEQRPLATTSAEWEEYASQEKEEKKEMMRRKKKRKATASTSSTPQLSNAAFICLFAALLLAVTCAFWLQRR